MIGFGSLLLAVSLVVPVAADPGSSYTLYRNSARPNGATARLHVATFDADDGEDYNRGNCEVARGLFQQQPGVTVRFWCERGRYRK